MAKFSLTTQTPINPARVLYAHGSTNWITLKKNPFNAKEEPESFDCGTAQKARDTLKKIAAGLPGCIQLRTLVIAPRELVAYRRALVEHDDPPKQALWLVLSQFDGRETREQPEPLGHYDESGKLKAALVKQLPTTEFYHGANAGFLKSALMGYRSDPCAAIVKLKHWGVHVLPLEAQDREAIAALLKQPVEVNKHVFIARSAIKDFDPIYCGMSQDDYGMYLRLERHCDLADGLDHTDPFYKQACANLKAVGVTKDLSGYDG